jgi:hypothetical protein
MTRCHYLAEEFPSAIVEYSPFTGRPWAGRDVQGYGRKIPTDYKVSLNGRKYRVYVCCFGNAGTAYIKTKDFPFLVLSDLPAMEAVK